MSRQALIQELQRLENLLRDNKLGPRQVKYMTGRCQGIKISLNQMEHQARR